MALAAAAILLLTPLQASWSSQTNAPSKNTAYFKDLDLPAALAEDDSFEDLPFEQLRQALREEVERGPKKGLSPRSSKKYNFLIR